MPVFLQRLWIQVTSDKRRFGLLVGCLGLGLLLWGRIIVISHPPRRAVADDGATTVVKDSTQVPGDQKSDKSPRLKDLETVYIRLAERPARDPFRINSQFFPKRTLPQQTVEEAPKSTPAPAEEPMQVIVQRERELRSELDRMKLGAVMKGSPIMAVINGRMYSKGERVPFASDIGRSFILSEIRSRSVLLECDGFVFELRMPFSLDGGR